MDRTRDGVRTKSLKRDEYWRERGIMTRSISGASGRVKRLFDETCGHFASSG